GKAWILIPIVALACFSIASFMTLHIPLLVDLISLTYGHGIFELNNVWYNNQMIELYLALNPDERFEYMEQIRAQDCFEMLEAEYAVYQTEMELKLVEAEKSKSFWKKMFIVLVVLFLLVKLF
ncbi:hypothetical protein Tco_1226829, partial [Tanacetum coccineum]